MGIYHVCPTTENLHPGLLQHVLVDAVEARDLPVLVRQQRRPIEGRFADGPAEGARDGEILAEVRGVGEELLGDAADVDAGAAEAVRLGDRDARAIARRDPAGANATRASPDGEEVVIELQRGAATSGS
jgi:hypothetical protein